jgi:hypothetical protein
MFVLQRLDGTIRGDVRKQAMDHFNAEGSPVRMVDSSMNSFQLLVACLPVSRLCLVLHFHCYMVNPICD